MCNLDPDELSVDDEEYVKHLDRLDPNELVASYANASIDDIVVVAEQLREKGAGGFGPHWHDRVERCPDRRAGSVGGPGQRILAYWMSRQFPGFPPLLPSMNEAA